MDRLVVFALLVNQAAAALSVQPLVHWSMDSYRGSTLLPDFGDVDSYSIDFPASGNVNYVKPGVIGNALFLSKKKIKFIEDIWRSDCIRNPVVCADGLTISFWLKVDELKHDIEQIILRSTNPSRSRPGVFIGGDEEGMFLFFVRTAEGKQYQATLQWSNVLHVWTHLTMSWNSSAGIQVFVNGSQLLDDLYVKSPSVDDVETSYPSKVDLIAGDILGPVFLLDDLWIFYHKLADDEIYSIFELGIPKETEPVTLPTSFTNETTSLYTNDVTENSEAIKLRTAAVTQRGNATGSAMKAKTTVDANMTNDVTENSEAIKLQTAAVTQRGNATGSAVKAKTTVDANTAKPQNVITTTKVTGSPESSSQPSISIRSTSMETLRVVTVGPQTTTTSYNEWFFMQPWYHAFIGTCLFALFAFSTWLCIIHCCIPAVEERNALNTKKDQTTNLEPLIQKA